MQLPFEWHPRREADTVEVVLEPAGKRSLERAPPFACPAYAAG